MISKPLFRVGDVVHAFYADDAVWTVSEIHIATLSEGMLVAYSFNDPACYMAAPKMTEARRILPYLDVREDWI